MNSTEEMAAGRPIGTGRGWLRMVVLAMVTVVVFWLLFRNIPIGRMIGEIRDARLLPLVLGLLLTVTFPILSGLRWRAVMGGLGIPISMRESTSMILACFTLSTFTPSKGGDIARAWFLRGRAPMSTVLGSVLAERILDVLTLLAFCFIGALSFRWRTLSILSGLLLAGGIAVVAGLLFLRFPYPAKIRPKIERGLEALRVLIRRPGLLGGVLAFTLLNWLASFVQVWLFYRSLGATGVPFGRVCAVLPVAIFVGLLPVTIAGMGTRDAVLIRLLAAQATPAVSLGVGMLYSLCGYWIPGIVGIPFLSWAMRRRNT